MAGVNVPKFHNEDIKPAQKLTSALEARIIAFGNRINADQENFVTICDEYISKEVCNNCALNRICMSSTVERS